MTEPFLDRVVIVGPGLIGGSLGLVIREAGLARTVVGVGHRQNTLDLARHLGAVDETSLDPASAVNGADLVVLATGVRLICRMIPHVVPKLKPGAVLTDVGSVKASICAAAADAFGPAPQAFFLGSHPLAGSEKRGIEAARADLFQGALCVLTPVRATDPEGKARRLLRALWESVGCDLVERSPEEHDHLLAQISHLPHLAAAALVNAVSDGALPLAATGFMDTTRVASGDPDLWVDICLENRQAIASALRSLQGEVQELALAVESGHAERLRHMLDAAKRRRDARRASAGG